MVSSMVGSMVGSRVRSRVGSAVGTVGEKVGSSVVGSSAVTLAFQGDPSGISALIFSQNARSSGSAVW